MKRNPAIGIVAFVVFVATIVAANWAVTHWAPVPVWPKPYLKAPAAVYFVALALIARDFVQWHLDIQTSILAIALGIGLSYWLADAHVATASAAGFAGGELTNLALFTAVILIFGRRRWIEAAATGGFPGAVVDSLLFLGIANPIVPGTVNNWGLLDGQLVGKCTAIAVGLLLLSPVRLRRQQRELVPSPA